VSVVALASATVRCTDDRPGRFQGNAMLV